MEVSRLYWLKERMHHGKLLGKIKPEIIYYYSSEVFPNRK